MKENVIKNLSALRGLMAAAAIDAAIINKTDPHQSEYIGEHWALLKRLSSFTGSNATMVITASKALLWTDSRYFLQAADELQGTSIELMKEDLPGTPSISQWLCGNLPAGASVGIDGMLFSAAATRRLASGLSRHGIKLRANFDPIAATWPDRPSLPDNKIFVHALEYAGATAYDKIAEILAETKSRYSADAIFISALDEIAWTLNIRAHDIPYTTVATSFLFLSPGRKVLFVSDAKLTPEVSAHLAEAAVDTLPYSGVSDFLSKLPAENRVLIDPERNAIAIIDTLGTRAIEGTSPVALLKAVKNPVQLAGVRAAMERDGVALINAFMDLERRLNNGETVTELDIARIFRTERAAQQLFFDESFGLIAGFGPHGAIVHYEADAKTNATITDGNLLLIDSGAQYLDGTTDITRTIAIGGHPTEQQRRDFTLVMKGHIALATAIFPKGTTGHQLDALARQFLWNNGLNYLHGTGHGVGHFLNVHEGPQSIRLNHVPTPLLPGMITSDEPGLYRENVHGIRCENLVLTVPAMTTEFGEFLTFEPLTLCPFDITLFDTDLMTDREIKWVNDYHRTVRDRLTPLLNSLQRTWLEKKTAPLTRARS